MPSCVYRIISPSSSILITSFGKVIKSFIIFAGNNNSNDFIQSLPLYAVEENINSIECTPQNNQGNVVIIIFTQSTLCELQVMKNHSICSDFSFASFKVNWKDPIITNISMLYLISSNRILLSNGHEILSKIINIQKSDKNTDNINIDNNKDIWKSIQFQLESGKDYQIISNDKTEICNIIYLHHFEHDIIFYCRSK